jgi:endonuclease/exonuclease/phosphatase family metal-dependent hydrolase
MKKLFTNPYIGLRGWNKLILSINFLVLTALLLAFLAPFVHPDTAVIFAFFGLLSPLFLLFAVIMLVYWLVIRKRQYIYTLIVLVIGILPLSNFFQVTFFSTALHPNKSFKVMTFNVRVFDLYNWHSNVETKDSIIAFIQRVSPEVICFQEYYRGDDIHFSVNDELKNKVGLTYVFEHFTGSTTPKNKVGKNNFGSAIYSKFPIVNSGVVVFPDDKSNNVIFADIVKDADTIRVYNGHIGSIRLQYADYLFLGDENQDKYANRQGKEQNIQNRMIVAYRKRAHQTVLMMEEIAKCAYPVILCVDLNDVPLSYAYRQVSKQLIDAFTVSGNGIDGTYIGDNFFNRIFPVNRIDYIFYSNEFQSGEFTTHTENLSDHRAVSVQVELMK